MRLQDLSVFLQHGELAAEVDLEELGEQLEGRRLLQRRVEAKRPLFAQQCSLDSPEHPGFRPRFCKKQHRGTYQQCSPLFRIVKQRVEARCGRLAGEVRFQHARHERVQQDLADLCPATKQCM